MTPLLQNAHFFAGRQRVINASTTNRSLPAFLNKSFASFVIPKVSVDVAVKTTGSIVKHG